MRVSDQIVIENVFPSVAGGKSPYKANSGRRLAVSADIYIHGTELVDARIRYRRIGDRGWKYRPMKKGDNDRWSCNLRIGPPGMYEFTVQAWVDRYTGAIKNIRKWLDAGEDISPDFHTIENLIASIRRKASKGEKRLLKSMLTLYSEYSVKDAIALGESAEAVSVFRKYQKKTKLKTYSPVLEIESVPHYGFFSSWYEIFPRSQTDDPGRPGTFRDCESTLEYVKSLGFDILYLTPVHPIGATNRRGKNGAMKAKKGDPGSPWAIGNAFGGHKSINPDLGTLNDFKRLLRKARRAGIEIALDIAFQCSPDHPYVSEHPEWFYHRPDGSIRYAENPPKKYYDIFPFNFDNPNWKELWEELKSIFLYWIEVGVRVFRVDNPHTKPFNFWKEILGDIKKEHPDVIFLAEAFTRPKVMYKLSRIGFTCSYSFFTWKNYDWEIEQYFKEISGGKAGKHFRPVLFANTPDILTAVLREGGRPAFIMRSVLAATLSPMWGIYSGFELCENKGVPGTEEYLNSEKYEIRARNFGQKGNIKAHIARLNMIRSENMQLQSFRNIEFLEKDNPNMVAYMRWADDPEDPLIIIVNINPFEAHTGRIRIPLWKLNIPYGKPFKVRDLMRDQVYEWQGEYNHVSLKPGEQSAHILRLVR
ncbi:hypothetical protein IX51_06195 [uncultured archaeon]|nr:hypothetical protein IX51_06195 [uncultured archaeon]